MKAFPLKISTSYTYKTLAPVAISQILGSLETLRNIDLYKDWNYLRGNASWRINETKLRNSKNLQRLARKIDSHKTVQVCAILNTLGCSCILASGNNRKLQVIGSLLALGSNKILKLRNSYGRDGADQMGNLILSYRLITSLIRNKDESDDLFLRATNAQTCLSYFVPGLAKACSNIWMRGEALEQILDTEAYGRSDLAKKVRDNRQASKLLNWITILWETFFPFIYLMPKKQAKVSLLLIKVFHLGVSATMNLPRFFWGFFGAHASVEYVIWKNNE